MSLPLAEHYGFARSLLRVIATQDQMLELTALAQENNPVAKEPFKEILGKTKKILEPFKETRVLTQEKIITSPETKKKTKEINRRRKNGELEAQPPVINFIENVSVQLIQQG